MWRLVLTSCVVIGTVMIPAVKAEDPVDIPDENLKAAIEQALGVKNPTASQLVGLTTLVAEHVRIHDLTGLQYANHLESLSLPGNSINAIVVLADLTDLKSLDLSDNRILDISALAKLSKLTSLKLSCWPYAAPDLSPLANLTSLTSLVLSGYHVSDLSALAGLTNLTSLDLSGMEIADLSALAGLTKLTSLNLSDHYLSDLSALARLTNLQSLDLSITDWRPDGVSDVSALAGLTNLTSLNLAGNDVSDISVLADLTNLRSLNLSNTYVSDVSVLAGLTNLTSLDVSDNGNIRSISPLAGLTNLSSLNLSRIWVSDISALAKLTKLTTLDLSGNRISDFSLLGEFTNLTTLDLSGTGISDISPLAKLTNLTTLHLSDNTIPDLSAYVSVLGGLPHLGSLSLSNDWVSDAARLSDISAVGKLTDLAWLDLSENTISDISGLSVLADLSSLSLKSNEVIDISALAGLKKLTSLDLTSNPLSAAAHDTYIPLILQNNPGVSLYCGSYSVPALPVAPYGGSDQLNVYPVTTPHYSTTSDWDGCWSFDKVISKPTIVGVGPGAATMWRVSANPDPNGSGTIVCVVGSGGRLSALDHAKVAQIAYTDGVIDVIASTNAIYVYPSASRWSYNIPFSLLGTGVAGVGPGRNTKWSWSVYTYPSGGQMIALRHDSLVPMPSIANVKVGEIIAASGIVDVFTSFGPMVDEGPPIPLFQCDRYWQYNPCTLYGTQVVGIVTNCDWGWLQDACGVHPSSFRVSLTSVSTSVGNAWAYGRWSSGYFGFDQPVISVYGEYVNPCSIEALAKKSGSWGILNATYTCTSTFYPYSGGRYMGSARVVLAQDIAPSEISAHPDGWTPGMTLNKEMCSVLHTLTTSSAPGGKVSQPGQGTFSYSVCELATVRATPDEYCRLERWSGSFVDDYGYSPSTWIRREGSLYPRDPSYASSPLFLPMDRDWQVRAHFMTTLKVLYVDDDAPADPGPNDPEINDPNEMGTPDHPFDSIQKAIELADPALTPTIIVRPGTYRENLDFLGKSLKVIGYDPNWPADGTIPCPVIDGGYAGPVVTVTNNEDANTVLANFTITRGQGTLAGGILCSGSQPTISDCLIVGNRCTALGGGGGIYCADSNAVIINCTISGNYGGLVGAGFYRSNSRDVILNSILWGNMPTELGMAPRGVVALPRIAFCDIYGYTLEAGNLNLDPLFICVGLWVDQNAAHLMSAADPEAVWIDGDYHLRAGSPCIDAGSSEEVPVSGARDLDGNARPLGPQRDIGAYEYHP